MKNNYLVILSSHINTEEKKDYSIETLKHLKNENIDVCISTHSSLYLTELSKYAKYVYYDNNNELVKPIHFFDNINLLSDENCLLGRSDLFIDFGGGKSSRFIPGPEHSKAALLLIRNGVLVAHTNYYKWVIYLEYDIPIPKNGYKEFIEKKIELLEKENKDCFYYKGHPGFNDYFWGGFFLCKTENIFLSKKLIQDDWNLNIKNWIFFWGISLFEYCVEIILNDCFTEDKIISKRIREEAFDEWGIEHFNLSRSNIITTDTIPNIVTHIYPHKSNDGIFKLYLFIYNTDFDVVIKNLNIFIDDTLIYELNDHFMQPHAWLIDHIKFKENDREIKLRYTYYGNNKIKSNVEQYDLKNIDKIHSYLLQINFNN